MVDKGIRAVGSTIRHFWSTQAAYGASSTRETDGTLCVYKDSGDTESTAGITDTEDADSTTGLHRAVINTGADGTFYSSGSEFHLVIKGAVIDQITVNIPLCSFRLGTNDVNVTAIQANAITQAAIADDAITGDKIAGDAIGAAQLATDAVAEIVAGVWAATTRQLTATGLDLITWPAAFLAAVRSAVGLASANLDTQLGDVPTVSEFNARTMPTADYATAAGVSAVETDTQDLQAKIGTPSNLGSGATVAANLVDIEGQTDEIGAAGAGLTAVPWNSAWDAEVQSECADALTAYDPPTEAEMNARTLAAAQYATLAKQGDIETDTQDIQAKIGTPTDLGNGTATLAANLQVVEGQTDDIGAAGAGLTNLPWNPAWDAEVQSEATDALNAYDPPTKTELDAGLAALNDLSGADVNAEVDAALADYDGPTKAELDAGLAGLNDLSQADVRTALGMASADLDTQLDALAALIAGLNNLSQANIRTALGLATANLDTQLSGIASNANTAAAQSTGANTKAATIQATTDKLEDTLEDQGGGVFGFTEEALQEAPSGGGGGGDATLAKQEEILDAIADLNVDALTGPNVLTVTVTNSVGGAPVEGALVRASKAGVGQTKRTNASGQAAFTIEDGTTWALSVWDGRFIGQTRTGISVSGGTAAEAFALVALTYPSPENPSLCTLVIRCLDKFGQPKPGAKITISNLAGNGTPGISPDSEGWEETANAEGDCIFGPTDEEPDRGVIRGGAVRVMRGASVALRIRFDIPEDEDVVSIEEVVGQESDCP